MSSADCSYWSSSPQSELLRKTLRKINKFTRSWLNPLQDKFAFELIIEAYKQILEYSDHCYL
ncbi:hypothetical protein T4B_11132 [Trichinella pseudospiralis]|uniref:Uncharacterized protein n=2 Tax=Trichinella pseudospiralis TaxID=6337 RepID=A0A0V1FJ72_TRIPS|nr:hypothetical protein T4A_4422 [Trichinella pseudospiralis]KRY86018.1 hypothetical protein T4D_5378 [Trichinella pseudospiralis]KRY88011.1 hypothetical protein T4D_6047 [Trichinella pseudospiralis]KRY88045.1 hypothetical protein T4D_7593 [Trichinella pseudospiralis]KRZ27649.1 hypothetical protein T4B_1120 [Trichinella pseudospiralis]